MATRSKLIHAFSLLFRLGLTTFFIIAGGIFLGFYIDQETGAQPVFTLSGTTLGVAGSFYWTYREVTRGMGEDWEDDEPA